MPRWRRILDDSTAERALEAVQRIADDLTGPEIRVEPTEAKNPHSLGFGTAGLAVFFAHLARCNRLRNDAEFFAKLLDHAISGLSQTKMTPGLFGGFTGIAWAFAHVQTVQPIQGPHSCGYDEIDETLSHWAALKQVPAEFLDGVSGVCVFIAERQGIDGKLARAILSQLRAKSVQFPVGRAWEISPRVLAHLRLVHTTNFDCTVPAIAAVNMSHGVAGIAAALERLYGKNICRDESAQLIETAVNWILNHRLVKTGERELFESFPTYVGVQTGRTCTGWCNGDLGISLALFNMGQSLRQPEWVKIALVMARKEAQKRLQEVEECNQINYGICHGSAGRAHIFNRFFAATGDEQFAEAAKFWIDHTLSMQMADGGIGGFLLHEVDGTRAARGLLTGAAGLGLVLLAAATDIEPSWDRVFLMGDSISSFNRLEQLDAHRY
jgi:lantibiotic modifying enzyme